VNAPPRILVVGLGSIGRRHIAALAQASPNAEVLGLRRQRAGQPDRDIDGIPIVSGIDDPRLADIEAAIVATPAPTHVDIAATLAARGVHVLVEKPLSDRLEGIDDLITRCRDRGLVLQVGYCLRFATSLRALKDAAAEGAVGRVLSLQATVGQYLPDWRPDRDYRETVSARAAEGGGALFELSHEIDYARWIGGEITSVCARTSRVGDLTIDVEDSADLLVTFENGAVGNIHLDMLQRPATRTCVIVGTEGTLHWDGIKRQTRLFRADVGTWQLLSTGEDAAPDQMYVDQLQHFLTCAKTGQEPSVTGADGRSAVEIVLAARRSSADGTIVRL